MDHLFCLDFNFSRCNIKVPMISLPTFSVVRLFVRSLNFCFCTWWILTTAQVVKWCNKLPIDYRFNLFNTDTKLSQTGNASVTTVPEWWTPLRRSSRPIGSRRRVPAVPDFTALSALLFSITVPEQLVTQQHEWCVLHRRLLSAATTADTGQRSSTPIWTVQYGKKLFVSFRETFYCWAFSVRAILSKLLGNRVLFLQSV